MIKLWSWLYKLSRREIEKSHLNRNYCDVKCPNCKEWFSISGVLHQHEHVSCPEFGYHLRCGQCNHESYWNAVSAPILLLCDSEGHQI